MNEEQSEPSAVKERVAEGVGQPRSRRELLKAMGAAAGLVAAGRLLAPDPVDAADNGNLVLGQANTATVRTSLATSGTISNDGALSVSAPSADFGVYGSGKNYGLAGVGPGGVLGLGTVGGVFSGSVVAINLDPQTSSGTPAGQAFKGDMLVDSVGVLYLCVSAGTPGTWIQVSHGGFRPLDPPVRAYDSRSSQAGKLTGGAILGTAGTPRTIPIVGVVPGVPANAVAVAGNLTVTEEAVSPTGGGFATIWPSGAWPGTSNINFTTVDIANSFTVGLSGTGSANVAASVATHVIIDISGYIL